MEQTIETFTGTKNVHIDGGSSDVEAGIEFIYNMREHMADVVVATLFGLVVYGLILYMKAKIK